MRNGGIKLKHQIMRIRKLRQRAEMSVSALAANMGVYAGDVNNWEHEVYLPMARQLPALAAALGCSIDALYTQGENGCCEEESQIEAQRTRVRFGEDELGNERADTFMWRGENGRREDEEVQA